MFFFDPLALTMPKACRRKRIYKVCTNGGTEEGRMLVRKWEEIKSDYNVSKSFLECELHYSTGLHILMLISANS